MKKIAMSGSSGLVGTALSAALGALGYEVWPMVRRRPQLRQEIFYDTKSGEIEIDKLAQCDAVINLAGKNIGGGLWTRRFKEELWHSRVDTTKLIAEAMAKMGEGPQVLLSASAFGFYGDTKGRAVEESAQRGEGFLAKLCEAWETASLIAARGGARVVLMRFAHVISPEGGLMAALAPAFKIGFGPIFGNGKQGMPVIALDDLVAAIIFALKDQSLRGPVNMACPNTPTNKEFSKELALAFKRPQWLHVPQVFLKILGEQGAMLLYSCRPLPHKLKEHGFSFRYENVQQILRAP